MCKICLTYKSREMGCVGFYAFTVIRIAETAVSRALAVCGGERGGFAVTVRFACLYACGWGNMPRSSRCIPLR